MPRPGGDLPHECVSVAVGTAGESVDERLIIALDVSTIAEAERLVAQLDGLVSFFKIGLQLHFVPGLEAFTERLLKSRKKLFWDLKINDIGETTRGAVSRAGAMGVSFITVHGNPRVMAAAVEGKAGTRIKVLCVTLLTSLDVSDFSDLIGDDRPISAEDIVLARTRKALECGCDGVITSTHEIEAIRRIEEVKKLTGPDRFLVVTPGIRPAGAGADEHRRSGTPAQAIAAGADYLVVGRPIIRSLDPVAATGAILDDMRVGLRSRR